MNLEDALGNWPSGGNQPPNPAWQPGPSGGGGGGGVWPGGPAGGPAGGGGGVWPGGPAGGGGGVWPGGPAGGGAGGGGGVWPGGPAGGGGGVWPGGPAGGGAGGGGGVWPSPQPSAPGPGPGSASALNLGVPFTKVLPSGVYDKLLITISGTIRPNADMFTVDLAASGDIAFHFNPRFNDQGRKVIVRNSCIGSKWGVEERELGAFPFSQGQPFEMKILCTNSEFKVAVNNSHLLDYKHRFKDLRSIKSVGIYKDLTLSRVLVETIP